MREEKFSIYGIHIPKKRIEYMLFIHAPVPHPKLPAEFFQVSLKTKEVGKTMICI